jgi:hypothetical protein
MEENPYQPRTMESDKPAKPWHESTAANIVTGLVLLTILADIFAVAHAISG